MQYAEMYVILLVMACTFLIDIEPSMLFAAAHGGSSAASSAFLCAAALIAVPPWTVHTDSVERTFV